MPNEQIANAHGIEAIRQAHERVLSRTKPAPRLSIGQRNMKAATSVLPNPMERRRRRIAAAIAHLKRQCILVTPTDRSAMIRRYRVTGKQALMLAEDVIEMAVARGMTEADNG